MSNHLHQWWDSERPVTTDSVAVDLGLDPGLFVPLVVLGFDLFAGISGLSSLSLELVLDLGTTTQARSIKFFVTDS